MSPNHFILAALVWVLVGVSSLARAEDATAESVRGPHDATSHRTFEDVDYWKKVFDDPARDAWQKPSELVRALRLHPGMRVADLGAGTGYFSRYLSQAVGETGAVFAVEVEPRLVEHIRQRAEAEGATNVIPVLTSTGDVRLPHRSIDLVLIVDTYHHLDDRLTYLRRLSRVLSPVGRVAVVDWFKRELPEGPPPEHKLAREHVLSEMTEAGYQLAEEPTFLPYQYFLIFKLRKAR